MNRGNADNADTRTVSSAYASRGDLPDRDVLPGRIGRMAVDWLAAHRGDQPFLPFPRAFHFTSTAASRSGLSPFADVAFSRSA